MNNFLIEIGKRIKSIRKKQNITISKLAQNSNVSNGLISRIENGRTIPSLPVLLEITRALNIDTSTFFEEVEKKKETKYIHIKKDDQKIIKNKINTEQFSYHQILEKNLRTIGFEVAILTLEPNSERKKTTIDAWALKYITSGQCEHYIDDEIITLQQGDSLYFNGKLPHLLINKTNTKCIILALYFYEK